MSNNIDLNLIIHLQWLRASGKHRKNTTDQGVL
jgi:hypothetical protein